MNLIIFPSWLSHGSHEDTNMSLERVALSFNTQYFNYMAIGRGQISAQIDGKLRGARGEKKKKLQVKKKLNSKKPKVFKVQSKSDTI